MQTEVIGRLAPSPTGYLHLGNVWSFLIGWLAIRSENGTVILRIDDIDPQRSKQHFEDAIIYDLKWLGLDWDGEIYRQSRRTAKYLEAIEQLQAKGLLYPCFCSRKELRLLANAPHTEDYCGEYPETCYDLPEERAELMKKRGRPFSTRFHCPRKAISFRDKIYGAQHYTSRDWGGDFAIRRSDGVFAYQLASAVDDALLHVTTVVRGRDLLSSTPRQILLLETLGMNLPTFAHVPLLLDNFGERLAKRHSSLSVQELRKSGIKASQIIGSLAKLAGLNPAGEEVVPKELVNNFQLQKLPRQDQIINEDELKKDA